jgi:histidyl-tRNA synthetase
MPQFRTVRGMRDFLPEEAKAMKYVEGIARSLAQSFGYSEVVTPVVESYDLLAAKAGEEVRLRMFSFKDLGGRRVALRPEFTPSVARIVATSLRNEPKPLRIFSFGSLYRYDEPQRGRHREFWQSNFELFGSDKPEADAELLLLTHSLMSRIGLKNCFFKIGHVGVLRGILSGEGLDDKVQNAVLQLMDKKQYADALGLVKDSGASKECLAVLRNLVEIRGSDVFKTVEMTKECVGSYEKAVAATRNLEEILELIAGSESEISMRLEAGFARGLEYYTGIVFEVYVPTLDVALSGGGRYDKLIELFGGEATPAVGVANGIDRIMLAMSEQKVRPIDIEGKTVVVIPVGDEARTVALRVSGLLRKAGVVVILEVMERRILRALEDADRRKVDYAVIVGKKELERGEVVLRDLKKREQIAVKIVELTKAIIG